MASRKEARAAKKAAKAAKGPGRLAQIRESYRVSRQHDKRLPLILLGWFLVVAVVVATVSFLLLHTLVGSIISGILAGVLAALIVFGRRAPKAIIGSFRTELGAGARALSMLQRGWKVDPFIAINRQQDSVTRVVGPPGIVLVGEGNPNRLRQLLISERRRHERVVSETPIHEVLVGDGEGQVKVENLVKHVSKMGKAVKPAQMTQILDRLRAIDAGRSPVPMPKGPLPTSAKGLRQGMRGR